MKDLFLRAEEAKAGFERLHRQRDEPLRAFRGRNLGHPRAALRRGRRSL